MKEIWKNASLISEIEYETSKTFRLLYDSQLNGNNFSGISIFINRKDNLRLKMKKWQWCPQKNWGNIFELLILPL